MLDNIIRDIQKITSSAKSTLCSEDSEFEAVMNAVEAVLDRYNISRSALWGNRYNQLALYITDIIECVASRYRLTCTNKQFKRFVNSILSLGEVVFPINASNNDYANNAQSIDFDIQGSDYLSITEAKSLKSFIISSLLKAELTAGQYNLFAKMYKSNRKYLTLDNIQAFVREILKTRAEADDIEHDLNTIQELCAGKSKEELAALRARMVAKVDNIHTLRAVEYIDTGKIERERVFYDHQLEACTKDTLSTLHEMILDVEEYLDKDKLIETISLHLFPYLRKAIAGITHDKVASLKENCLEKHDYVDDYIWGTMDRLIDNIDKDEAEFRRIKSSNDTIAKLKFICRYTSLYIYPIANCWRYYDLDNSQRVYLSTLYNETMQVGGSFLTVYRGMRNISDEERIAKSEPSDEDIAKYLHGYIDAVSILESKIDEILNTKLDTYFDDIKKTEFGKNALENVEGKARDFLMSGLNAYELNHESDRFDEHSVDEALSAIKSNRKLMENIAIAESNYHMFKRIFPDNVAHGDYTFAVVVFIKCIERYLKEVLAQHFPRKIHKTSDYGTVDQGLLSINPRVINVIDADYLSSRQVNTFFTSPRADFGGIECGTAYYALKYIKETLHSDEIGDLTHEYSIRENGRNMNVHFGAEWLSKVRNGYFHIENLDSMADAEDNKNKTAFWLIHLTHCLPKLER